MNTQEINNAIIAYIKLHPYAILFLIWAVVWKLIALWKAAKHDHLVMFIVLTFVNTLGLAEIIYVGYLYFRDRKNKEVVK